MSARRALATRHLLAVLVSGCLLAAACTASTTKGHGQASSSGTTPAVSTPDRLLIGKPAERTGGSPDADAADFARTIAKAGPAALPAFVAAVQASGFGIRDLDSGAVVIKPAKPSQGLAFLAGEVVATSRLIPRGFVVRLGDLTEVIRKLAAPLPANAPIQNLIVAGLRTNARSKSATLRFWARTVIELGKHAPQPYDLAANASPDDLLDAVQMMFVLLRLFGDLHRFVPPGKPTPTPVHSLVQGKAAACTPGERESEILDLTGILGSYGFEKLIDYIGEEFHFHGVERYAKGIGRANAALALIKYIAIFATFNAKLEMVNGEPLVRNKSRDPGEVKLIRVEVKVDADPSPFINCLRTLLNGVGLDFSLPAGGPVKEAEVTWTLYDGDKYVRLCELGCSDGQRPSSDNAQTGHTDEEGRVDVGMEGNPRRRALPEDATLLHRTAAMRASVNLKPAKLFRDISDAIGTVTVGLPGAPIVFTGELLQRIGVLGANRRFAITDFGEAYHVVAHLRVVNESGADLDYAYRGDIEVDENGTITGTGEGTLDGLFKCKHYQRSGLTFRLVKSDNASASGTWIATFSGQKEGDKLALALGAKDIHAVINGLTGGCRALGKIYRDQYANRALDPAYPFGVDQFVFDPREGGHAKAERKYTEVIHASLDPGTPPLLATFTETSEFTIKATKL